MVSGQSLVRFSGRSSGSRVMRIYVGNLPFSVNDAELGSMFTEFGNVSSSQVIIDRDTGRSRGFGFVEMDDDAGRGAIEEMNGREVGGRSLVVNEARERQPRSWRRRRWWRPLVSRANVDGVFV